jgi:hypothetical protein
MAFPRCNRCDKALAAGLACNQFVAEPVHGPHHDQPSWPAGAVQVNVVASISSSSGMGVWQAFPSSRG